MKYLHFPILFFLFIVISYNSLAQASLSCDLDIRNNSIQRILFNGLESKAIGFTNLYLSRGSTMPILGVWENTSGGLLFTPTLPLSVDETYFLYYTDSENQSKWQTVSAGNNKPIRFPVEVVGIYPSASKLPENLLRFYIEFNQPMQENNYLQYISLVDQTGKELKGVFLPSRFEYWNKERTKLTVILDPGRVKTGLLAHKQLGGRAIRSGQHYTLKIKGKWLALSGSILSETYSKTFEVIDEDMRKINLNCWGIALPKVNSKNEIKIYFERSLDHINALSLIRVTDQFNNPIQGKYCLSGQERVLSFTPSQKWMSGQYRVLVNTKLEDVCGNNLIHGFDVYQASKLAAAHQKDFHFLSIELK